MKHEILIKTLPTIFFLKKVYLWRKYYHLCKNAIEDLAYPIETQTLKFWILGVVIYPEMQNKILRPMVKKLAQLDLQFELWPNNCKFCRIGKILQFFGAHLLTASPIEQNPLP